MTLEENVYLLEFAAKVEPFRFVKLKAFVSFNGKAERVDSAVEFVLSVLSVYDENASLLSFEASDGGASGNGDGESLREHGLALSRLPGEQR